MVGQRVESRQQLPVVAIAFLIIAAVFLAFAVANWSLHLGLAAVMPATLGVALLLTRPRHFAADLTEFGLEIHEPPLTLPYDAINGVAIEGRPRAAATVRLVHMRGVLMIPARLNVRSDRLYEFLLSRIPQTGSRELNPDLMPFLLQQEELFGPDKVFSYLAQWHAKAGPRHRAVAVCAAVAVTGVAWVCLGALGGGQDFAPWIGWGICLGFFFALLALAFYLGTRSRRIRNWRASGIVIAPGGLALIQGELRGQLRWDELRKVEFRHTRPWYHFESREPARGIRLLVEGATILIADIYDRPLPLIYQQIRGYWRRLPADVD